jgi:hypothetical protein
VLAWTDAPSSSAAQYNLVNDLDLEVEGPNGHFLGNVFANGQSVTGGTADRLNNVEVVRLANAAAGGWTVTVAPHAIGQAGQDFALVVVGDVTADPVRRLREGGRIAP